MIILDITYNRLPVQSSMYLYFSWKNLPSLLFFIYSPPIKNIIVNISLLSLSRKSWKKDHCAAFLFLNWFMCLCVCMCECVCVYVCVYVCVCVCVSGLNWLGCHTCLAPVKEVEKWGEILKREKKGKIKKLK